MANGKTLMKPPSRTARTYENIFRISNFDGKELFRYSRLDRGDRIGKVDLGEWKSHRNTFIIAHDNARGCKALAQIEATAAI